MGFADKAFSQFRSDDRQGKNLGEHRGRTATLKAVAYTTAEAMTDERNGRQFDFSAQHRNERILFAALFVPTNAPDAFQRGSFASLKEHQQFVFSSLAKHEEKQKQRGYGNNPKGNPASAPIISRHDVCLLDKRLMLNPDGSRRPDGLENVRQVMTDFLRENYTRKGLIASCSVHDQDAPDGAHNGNFHVHIVSSYRALTPDGWGERLRPFGKQAWAKWRATKAHSLKNIQTRKLVRLGAIAAAPSLDHPRAYKLLNQKESAHGKTSRKSAAGKFSTSAIVADRIRLCQNPMQDLRGWGDDHKTGRNQNSALSVAPRMDDRPRGEIPHSGLRQVGIARGLRQAGGTTARGATSLIIAKYDALIEQAKREGKHDLIPALRQRCADEIKAARKKQSEDMAIAARYARRLALFSAGLTNSL